ncbi:Crp/Fnr family transcriptional regulator [Microvirga sp. VF16]|uniref:Crp/Fnr family transcriptional regulator n=1 Tax=Microvirga sp. VF16 TaxID=2807101 RepID=UPI00193E1C30|nr:Crp/Fnr family transcriptional regulator [Microvirga sp. VF16]QRM35426.1 Crp/Fnr family transcriptional regulator [Microvirga sp. VF16]
MAIPNTSSALVNSEQRSSAIGAIKIGQADKNLCFIKAFQDVPLEVVNLLAQRCQWRFYKASRPILRCGDNDREVYFIARGSVGINFFSFSGREISFRDLSTGDMFGELSAIDDHPRPTHTVALTDTVVAVMSSAIFWDLMDEQKPFRVAVLRKLSLHVRSLSERVIELSTLSVPSRVRAEVLRLADTHAPGQDRAVIFPAPTHAAIASRISTGREAVTRELNKLARAGIIEKRGSTLIVRDVGRLSDLVGREDHTGDEYHSRLVG